MFRSGYIVSGRADLVWYLGLPLLALGFALICQRYLSAVTMASVALWINAPHIMSTLLRVYGVAEDRQRFKDRLVVGPLVIFAWMAIGLKYAPLTVLLVQNIWNHQHFLMQIHGFTRIYDFKAKTGTPSTGRQDLLLNSALYVNMFLCAPLFVSFWLRELLRLGVPITADAVVNVQTISWTVLGVVALWYLAHVAHAAFNGYPINPIKYLYLASNVAVLYYVSWSTTSVLLYTVTNQIMHGVQYLVIVYYFLQRRIEQTGAGRSFVGWLVRPGHAAAFFLICVMFAVVQQLLLGKPLGEFGFGAIGSLSGSEALPDFGLGALTASDQYMYFAAAVLGVPNLLHLYFDSFIWKVRDRQSQQGL